MVFDRNPNPLGMYVRILRAYACKEASELSCRTARILSVALNVYSFEDVSVYERNHYRVEHIAENVYDRVKKGVAAPGLLPVELRKPGSSLSLW